MMKIYKFTIEQLSKLLIEIGHVFNVEVGSEPIYTINTETNELLVQDKNGKTIKTIPLDLINEKALSVLGVEFIYTAGRRPRYKIEAMPEFLSGINNNNKYLDEKEFREFMDVQSKSPGTHQMKVIVMWDKKRCKNI